MKTGYDWNKYNQTHYDHDNPPPKTVQVREGFRVRHPLLVVDLDVYGRFHQILGRPGLCTCTPYFLLVRVRAGARVLSVLFFRGSEDFQSGTITQAAARARSLARLSLSLCV